MSIDKDYNGYFKRVVLGKILPAPVIESHWPPGASIVGKASEGFACLKLFGKPYYESPP